MQDSIKRLKIYIGLDLAYQDYKEGIEPKSDFDKFCVQHCQDIENVINYIEDKEANNDDTRAD